MPRKTQDPAQGYGATCWTAENRCTNIRNLFPTMLRKSVIVKLLRSTFPQSFQHIGYGDSRIPRAAYEYIAERSGENDSK